MRSSVTRLSSLAIDDNDKRTSKSEGRMAPRGGNEKKESGRAKKTENANKKKETEEAEQVRLVMLTRESLPR